MLDKKKTKKKDKLKTKMSLSKKISTFLVVGLMGFSLAGYINLKDTIDKVNSVEITKKIQDYRQLEKYKDQKNIDQYFNNYVYTDEMFQQDLKKYNDFNDQIFEYYQVYLKSKNKNDPRTKEEIVKKLKTEPALIDLKYNHLYSNYAYFNDDVKFYNENMETLLSLLNKSQNNELSSEMVKESVLEPKSMVFLKEKKGANNYYILWFDDLFSTVFGNKTRQYLINEDRPFNYNHLSYKFSNMSQLLKTQDDWKEKKNAKEFEELYQLGFNKPYSENLQNKIDQSKLRMENDKSFQRETLRINRATRELTNNYLNLFSDPVFDEKTFGNRYVVINIINKMRSEELSKEEENRIRSGNFTDEELSFIFSGFLAERIKKI